MKKIIAMITTCGLLTACFTACSNNNDETSEVHDFNGEEITYDNCEGKYCTECNKSAYDILEEAKNEFASNYSESYCVYFYKNDYDGGFLKNYNKYNKEFGGNDRAIINNVDFSSYSAKIYDSGRAVGYAELEISYSNNYGDNTLIESITENSIKHGL